MTPNSPLQSSGQTLGMYIIAFALMMLLAAALQQISASSVYVVFLMLMFLVGSYVFAGLLAPTMRLGVFQRAHQSGMPVHIGQAIASGIISSAIYLLLSGEIYENGTDGLAWFSGWVLGAVMLAVLVAPGYCRTGASSLAQLLCDDKANRILGSLAMSIVVLCCGFLLLVQFHATAFITQQFLGIPGSIGVITGAIAICSCLVLGGIQSLSIARIILYPVIAAAFLLPLAWIASTASGFPVPQLVFGVAALQPVVEIHAQLVNSGLAGPGDIFNPLSEGRQLDGFNFIALVLSVGAGTAAMPHLIQHFGVVDTPDKARRSGIWALVFLLVVLSAVPAVAAFAKLELYTSLLGLEVAELAEEAEWIYEISGASAIRLVTICGQFVADYQAALAACGGKAQYILSVGDLGMSPDFLALASTKLARLPELFSLLIAMGGLAALWSTADGLLFAAANSLAEDGYFRLFRPKSPLGTRLFIVRLLLIIMTVLAATTTLWADGSPSLWFSAGFAISAGALFPALICRIWWPGIRPNDLLAGLLSGFVVTIVLLYLSGLGPDFAANTGDEYLVALPLVTDQLMPVNSGLIGMLASFAATGLSYVLGVATGRIDPGIATE